MRYLGGDWHRCQRALVHHRQKLPDSAFHEPDSRRLSCTVDLLFCRHQIYLSGSLRRNLFGWQ
ncbi:hypothetical protein TIFTF001_024609 [Ficus carica]|uniref:Uncharacterized protein n=1 Tax=Ficus carica TaxID=3494 RepID=A0AA88AI97_FICCA|nr:hypothetical protein TIFTF001_024609 [Ficus carica]